MRIVLDVETNRLINPDRIWVIVCYDIDSKKFHVFREPDLDAFKEWSKDVTLWIAHNGWGFDFLVLRDLLGLVIGAEQTIDTLIISKLVDFPRQGHSIEDYGVEFDYPKIDFKDFSKWSQELEDYCKRDVEITYKVYKKYLRYISDVKRQPSILLEHKFQNIVNELSSNGFYFNKTKANKYLEDVTKELETLDNSITLVFKPKSKLIREVKPRLTKYNTIDKSSIPKKIREALGNDLSCFDAEAPFSFIEFVEFNPSSHKQIIDVLHDAGWKPIDKTKTHLETEREAQRLKRQKNRGPELDLTLKSLYDDLIKLGKYGYKINENNLSTLIDKDKCLLKIKPSETLFIENMIKNLRAEQRKTLGVENIIKQTNSSEINPNNWHWQHTIKIPLLQNIDRSKDYTDFLLKIIQPCLLSKMDAVPFVKNENHLWSIIATPQGMFVDFSASYATDISDGLKDLTPKRQDILDQLKNSFYSAPAPARYLAKRILLEARRRTLTEWLSLVQDDNRIHGKFQGIGAWTHRMAHRQPNTANIPNEFDTAGKKKLLGKEMRSLWQVPKGRLLVGVDAEGIQLRIFAHYIDDPEFTKALVEGRKDDKSDPHSLNQRIIGEVCKSRAAAKRFIYALLLGAGLGKLREVLECSEDEVRVALERIMSRYQGFEYLKRSVIPADAKRGWFEGLDGRAVKIPGDTVGAREHLCMSGYLQNGEAIITKKACLLWHDKLKQEDIDFLLVNFVHDEWQTETKNDMSIALHIAKTQADALKQVGEELGLKCPLAGSYWNEDLNDYTIATNWAYTH